MYIIYLRLLAVPYFVYYYLEKAAKYLWLPWAICNRQKQWMQLLDSFQQLCYYYISHPASPSLSLPFFLSLLYMLSSFMLSLAINTHTHRYSKQQRVCDTESGIEILVRQLKYVLYFFFFFSFSFFLFCSRTFLFSAFPYFMFSLSFTILPFLPACLRSFWLLLRVAACRLLELPLATHTHTHIDTRRARHTHICIRVQTTEICIKTK